MAFFQAVRAGLAKFSTDGPRPSPEDLDHAIRQIISNAVASGEVVDIFSAAGLKRPDISILSDEFLAEVRDMKHRNLAVELLETLLTGEIKTRRLEQHLIRKALERCNYVQSRTAKLLGTTRRVLKYKMDQLEIEPSSKQKSMTG